jgi:hypothetical protein
LKALTIAINAEKIKNKLTICKKLISYKIIKSLLSKMMLTTKYKAQMIQVKIKIKA